MHFYKNKVKMMGFTDKVKTLISEFRQYSINQESLNDIEGKVEDYPTLKLKIQDLEIINNEFNKFIEKTVGDGSCHVLSIRNVGGAELTEGE